MIDIKNNNIKTPLIAGLVVMLFVLFLVVELTQSSTENRGKATAPITNNIDSKISTLINEDKIDWNNRSYIRFGGYTENVRYKNEGFSSAYATSDGGFITTGTSQSGNIGDGFPTTPVGYIRAPNDYERGSFGFIVKYNESGKVEWKNFYTEEMTTSPDQDKTSNVFVTFTDVIQLPDSDYLVAGNVRNYDPGRGIYTDFFLIKYDSSGKELWKKIVDYKPANLQNIPNGIIVNSALSDFVEGKISKIDYDGNLIWSNTLKQAFPNVKNEEGVLVGEHQLASIKYDEKTNSVITYGNFCSGLTCSYVGDRELVSLNADNGEPRWRTIDRYSPGAKTGGDLQWPNAGKLIIKSNGNYIVTDRARVPGNTDMGICYLNDNGIDQKTPINNGVYRSTWASYEDNGNLINTQSCLTTNDKKLVPQKTDWIIETVNGAFVYGNEDDVVRTDGNFVYETKLSNVKYNNSTKSDKIYINGASILKNGSLLVYGYSNDISTFPGKGQAIIFIYPPKGISENVNKENLPRLWYCSEAGSDKCVGSNESNEVVDNLPDNVLKKVWWGTEEADCKTACLAAKKDINCTKKSLGDANCDDKINEIDYNIWVRELQKTDDNITADFNGDKVSNVIDFSIWKANVSN